MQRPFNKKWNFILLHLISLMAVDLEVDISKSILYPYGSRIIYTLEVWLTLYMLQCKCLACKISLCHICCRHCGHCSIFGDTMCTMVWHTLRLCWFLWDSHCSVSEPGHWFNLYALFALAAWQKSMITWSKCSHLTVTSVIIIIFLWHFWQDVFSLAFHFYFHHLTLLSV